MRTLVNTLLDDISAKLGIGIDDIRGNSRRAELVFCRSYIACNLREAGYSLKAVGSVLNRTHSTVINLVNIWDNMVIIEPFKGLNERLNGDVRYMNTATYDLLIICLDKYLKYGIDESFETYISILYNHCTALSKEDRAYFYDKLRILLVESPSELVEIEIRNVLLKIKIYE